MTHPSSPIGRIHLILALEPYRVYDLKEGAIKHHTLPDTGEFVEAKKLLLLKEKDVMEQASGRVNAIRPSPAEDQLM